MAETRLPPLACERCGDPMTHHADKLVAPADPGDEALVDPALGGIVDEIHTCAGCGHVQARRLEPR
jgi:hypothetical protein